MEFLTHPHADFVVASYVLAAVALVALGVASGRSYCARVKEERALAQKAKKDEAE